MKQIQLNNGEVALIDDEDFDRVSRYKWSVVMCGRNRSYRQIRATMKVGTVYKNVRLHRFILGFPKSGIDHRDGNTLNAQKYNLRLANQSQNSANSKKKGSSSIYKGVSFNRRTGRWVAQLFARGIRRLYGTFEKEVDAAMAYNKAAVAHFGEFARLNDFYINTKGLSATAERSDMRQ